MIDYNLYKEILNIKGDIGKFLNDRHNGLKRAIMARTYICANCKKRNVSICESCENQKMRVKIIDKITEIEKFMDIYV